MTNCIESVYYSSLEVLKDSPHFKIDVLGFALALIMLIGLCICAHRGNNFLSDFYCDIGKFFSCSGIIGCLLISVVRIQDFVAALRIKMKSPILQHKE
jgi:hypothetical protein